MVLQDKYPKDEHSTQTPVHATGAPHNTPKDLVQYSPLKDEGGLGLPDIENYHKAILLTRIYEWSYPHSTKQWIQLENAFFRVPIYMIPWHKSGQTLLLHNPHPTITPTLHMWATLRTHEQISPYPSPLYQITHNLLFQPGDDDKTFKLFHKSAYLTLGNTVEGTGTQHIKPLHTLIQSQTSIQQFQYRQLTHFIQSGPLAYSTNRAQTVFEQYCSNQSIKKKLISMMYAIILSTRPHSLPAFTTTWEKELNIEISLDKWRKKYSVKSTNPQKTREPKKVAIKE
ncbi:Hypothetical predicted protein [Pelobates cultripes]|uniref:Reverse transcriptase n=1 Tax=Pelobates cultripes TaxID=61616 RepID=A0AAD1RN56_PELCU|nr:Hypothetical predicted protein [Pelobates cultripes]